MSKEYALWFIKTDNLPSSLANAKLEQISDWIRNEHPLGTRFDIIVVPSDVNKISILKSEKEFCSDFQGDSNKWLDTVKSKLEDCLTIHLSV